MCKADANYPITVSTLIKSVFLPVLSSAFTFSMHSCVKRPRIMSGDRREPWSLTGSGPCGFEWRFPHFLGEKNMWQISTNAAGFTGESPPRKSGWLMRYMGIFKIELSCKCCSNTTLQAHCFFFYGCLNKWLFFSFLYEVLVFMKL